MHRQFPGSASWQPNSAALPIKPGETIWYSRTDGGSSCSSVGAPRVPLSPASSWVLAAAAAAAVVSQSSASSVLQEASQSRHMQNSSHSIQL
jgi:hypothetical protein